MPLLRKKQCGRSPRSLLGAILLLAILVSGGCAAKGVNLRSVPKNPLSDTLQLTSYWGPQPTERTMQVLRVSNLEADLEGDPRKLLQNLQTVIDYEPTADRIYAFAELAYLGAKKTEKKDPQVALDLYGASVFYAYQYLFDGHFSDVRNPYDPQFRGACELYNGALEGALRIACKGKKLAPGQTTTIRTAAGNWDITCVLCGSRWRAEDIDHFEFCSDYEITGLKNHYKVHGLGVPLIAVRRSYEGEPAAAKYYPVDLSFPVTAFVRPLRPAEGNEGRGSGRHKGRLELYDPLVTSDIEVADRRVPLEADLSTPLAFFLSKPELEALATVGLLRPEELLKMRPDRPDPIMGLYMIQPYEPGKIPVVLVHGLWSSPMTWMAMFNDLRSSPEIRERYQFWFYLYPTGQPFWLSASQMRADMAELRRVLDPFRQEPALDQMVLVGHSMGGLVSRLQTIHSKNDYWDLVSSKPFYEVKADEEVRRKLLDTFFFQPNPSVRRVVTIGTPHRGSSFSNQTTQWLLGKLINLPGKLVSSQQKLFRDNKGLFRKRSLLKIENSIDSLSPESPIFPVMQASNRPPWVKYHNVIGLVPEDGWLGSLLAGGDGVVSEQSARVDDAVSEVSAPADHSSVHSHPLAVLEVRRILLRHLSDLRGGHPAGGPETRTADASVAEKDDSVDDTRRR